MLVFILLLGTGTTTAYADTENRAAIILERQEHYINDFADVLTQEDYTELNAILDRVDAQTGKEVVLVTINTLHDIGLTAADIEGYADALIDSWGVGDASRDDGVLILFLKSDMKIRIALGAGYAGQFDGAMQTVVNKGFLLYFRSGQYSQGLLEGTKATVEAVTVKISFWKYYMWHIISGALLLFFFFS